MKREEAYLYMRDRIIDRTWDVGKSIRVNDVCAMLGMSRTPVQEALTRLEQQGYVSITPQVGAFVRRPASEEVFERLLTRAALEAVTAEWAALRITAKQLDAIEAILGQMELSGLTSHEYANLNREFHRTIHLASGLSYVQRLVEQHWDYLEYAAETDQLFMDGQIKRSLAEHRMIFHGLKDGNGALTKQLMENHMVRVAHHLKRQNELTENIDNS
ncbi:GntR family transcriptional regulator [Paenibacillus validus]|uniref:GntR family transcriptional regulator n=1 Tax=Paenibacillus validus TaxID=44253 RepID=UPI003D2A21C1